MDSRRQNIALAARKLLIHAAAQAQRVVDYVLRQRSDGLFTIIGKLLEPASSLAPLKRNTRPFTFFIRQRFLRKRTKPASVSPILSGLSS
jgi:hypothetical protein